MTFFMPEGGIPVVVGDTDELRYDEESGTWYLQVTQETWDSLMALALADEEAETFQDEAREEDG